MEEKKMSLVKRFGKVLASPREAFEAIAQDPRILWPGMIITVITLITTLLILPETREYTEQILVTQGNSPDQIAIAMKFVTPSAIIGAVLSMPLIWLVLAAVLHIYKMFSVGEARFKQLYAVAIFSMLPLTIKSIITSGLVKVMGYKAALQVNASLALLFINLDSANFFYRLLMQIELFSVWGLVLLIIGGSIAMKKRSKGLAIYLGTLWIIFAVVTALISKTPV